MKRILLVVAILLAAALSGAGLAVADDTREADLEIEQPHYVDEDVEQTTDNASTVYVAEGEELRLYPQDFDTEDVVSYDISPDSGSLAEHPHGDGYVLRVEETGTHEISWLVEREITDGNETAIQQVRYEAAVRVEGDLDVMVVSASDYRETQDAADRWEDVADRAESLADSNMLLRLHDPDAEAVIDDAFTFYELRYHPLAALGAGLTLFFMGLFSLGGGSVVATLTAAHAVIVGKLRKDLNIHAATEATEGEAAERLEAQTIAEKKQALQNTRFGDLHLPHIADGMRSQGETPLEAWTNLSTNVLHPAVSTVYKAQAMGETGYVGVIPGDDLASDGGDDAELDADAKLRILRDAGERLTIVAEDDVDEDALTVDLREATREWLDVLPVNSHTMVEFKPAKEDFDRENISVEQCSWSLEELTERTQIDMRHFESERDAAAHLRDFLSEVREHPITDMDGRVRDCRFLLETLLRDAELLNDRHNIPVAQYQVDMLESAIADDDPVADGIATVNDIEKGKYA